MRRSIRSSPRRSAKRRDISRARLGVEALEDRTLMAVNLLGSFPGLSTYDGGSPPNPQLAAGPAHVGEVVNDAVAFFDKTTGENVFQESLRTLFSIPAGQNLGAPLLTYDELAERFVLGVQWGRLRNEPTALGFAVSNSSNPLDGFAEIHRIDMFGNRSARLGWNADAYVFAFDGFCPTGVACLIDPFAQVLTIDKSTVLDADPATLTSYRSTVFLQGDQVIVPAVMHGSSPGDPMWLMTESQVGTLRIYRMDNVLSSSPAFTASDFAFEDYGPPPPATQPGSGRIQTGDSRITNVAFRDNRLVAAQTVGVEGAARARWYDFDTTDGAPALAQSGEVNPGPGVHTYLPSIEIAANGDLGLTYAQSSSEEALSMYITGRRAADAPGTLQTPVLVAAGEAPLFGGVAGFYSGISVDPAGDSFWAANQYTLGIRAAIPNWATWIAQFSLSDNMQGERVEVTGTLRTGIVAIGGETTGVIIELDDGEFYELDLSGDPALAKLAEQLNGQRVVVTGILNIVPGVEIPIRRIITVETLTPATPSDLITVVGLLRTDIFAIGGETTGIVVFTAEGAFELASSPPFFVSPEFRQLADSLHGQQVRVTGRLTFVEGIEIGVRRIIIVESLALAL